MTQQGKLRHVAITVPDTEATATYYEKTFGLERLWKSPNGIMLSDGTVSLAILKFQTDAMAGDERGKDFHGIHHIGFVVDDVDAAGTTAESNGGRYHMQVPGNQAGPGERKYRDPNGVVFDIVDKGYASRSWNSND